MINKRRIISKLLLLICIISAYQNAYAMELTDAEGLTEQEILFLEEDIREYLYDTQFTNKQKKALTEENYKRNPIKALKVIAQWSNVVAKELADQDMIKNSTSSISRRSCEEFIDFVNFFETLYSNQDKEPSPLTN